jgi:hypothetical protein
MNAFWMECLGWAATGVFLDNLRPADRRVAGHHRKHTGFRRGSVDFASQIIHAAARLAGNLISTSACQALGPYQGLTYARQCGFPTS